VAGNCPTDTNIKYEDCAPCEGYWAISNKKFCDGVGGGSKRPGAVVKFVKTKDPVRTGAACPSGSDAKNYVRQYSCNECLNTGDTSPSDWNTSVTEFTKTNTSTYPAIKRAYDVVQNEPCSIWPNQVTGHDYFLDW
jgi:hypothetical protein